MANQDKKGSWSGIKAALRGLDCPGLVTVIRDLYDASPDNRRFLHARFSGSGTELEKYRTLILDAVYPNLFGRKPVRVGIATRRGTSLPLSIGQRSPERRHEELAV